MLMLVARKLEAGMDIIGCLLGGGGGYLEAIVCSEASSGYLAEADIEVPGAEVLEALTWVIHSLSPACTPTYKAGFLILLMACAVFVWNGTCWVGSF